MPHSVTQPICVFFGGIGRLAQQACDANHCEQNSVMSYTQENIFRDMFASGIAYMGIVLFITKQE